MNEILEANYRNLERVIGWIENADRKASIVLAFNGGLTALMFNNIGKLSNILRSSYSIPILFVVILFVGGFLISFGLSTYNALRVLLPDVKPRAKHKLFSFMTIVDFDQKEFEKKMTEDLTEDKIIKNLADQTHINSAIAKDKFQHLTRSWKLLAVAIIFGLLSSALILTLPTMGM